jgi:hypothetical protein
MAPVSVAVVLGVYAVFAAWLVLLGRRDDAHALARFIPDCIVLVTRLAWEPRVSRRRKLLRSAAALLVSGQPPDSNGGS